MIGRRRREGDPEGVEVTVARISPFAWRIINVLVGVIYLFATGWLGYMWKQVGEVDKRLQQLEVRLVAAETKQEGMHNWIRSVSERLRGLEQRR